MAVVSEILTSTVTLLINSLQLRVRMLQQVVDMFGCGLPVCAASYEAIDELVQEGQTGLLFTSYQELAQHWVHLLQGFPKQPSKPLLHMQNQVQQRTDSWSASWEKLKPLF